jgi:hypothetical protein
MFKCRICYEEKNKEEREFLGCSEKHPFCKTCFERWKKYDPSEICPYCRTSYVSQDPDPEEWLNLDPKEWIVYARTDHQWGIQKIHIYRRDEKQPSWRNDDYVIEMKRNRQRKRRVGYKKNDRY